MTLLVGTSSFLKAIALPPGVLLPALVLAGIARLSHKPRLAFTLIIVPLVATVLLSLPWIANLITGPLEMRALRETKIAGTPSAAPRTAVVLGGGVGVAWNSPDDITAYDLGAAADRVVAGARLYRAGKLDRLLLSGGSASGPSEAELMARFAADLGVPRGAMLLEEDSRSTHENAKASARLLHKLGFGNHVLLITSAMHLPRAMTEFRCAGLDPVGMPAEFESLSEKIEFMRNWSPSSDALDRSRRAIKEWIGVLAARC